ncbi:sigma factor-like helix-turn-helix DNA-binding protein [Chengkuizengella sediminis]|uniref:sigma factor-like helix-turn-helix DNA-binding protein n=1 Tax=Chengkuizengella sediminis TaxID=1885917 RepID=UPI001389A778|nr:sigma factor-like helix-turn-helix DNA-binding protein [Chengkuizengella sediminis]NDI35736.1 sigma-70 family RNA polymerase sigma factor [Chengkuizengella sediminis]
MSLEIEETIGAMDTYRVLLKRMAWRIQYAAKVRRKKEWLVEFDECLCTTQSFLPDMVSRYYLLELLSLLSSNKEKYILQKIYFEGFTELELAKELNISQQAVNKCKKKAIQTIRQKISSS